jgi:hypothetical protein
MPLPPNWAVLGAFALLGLLNPGFWLIGAGLELAYLLGLSHLPRFRALVDAQHWIEREEAEDNRLASSLAQLDAERRERFRAVEARCDRILAEQQMDGAISRMQRAGLDRLLAIHLRLLFTQAAMERLLGESGATDESLEEEIHRLKERAGGSGPELRRSLEAQVAILERRRKALIDGREKLAFANSELDRIEHQIALILDEVRLSKAPETIGSQIDRVSGELDETRNWVNEQQRLLETDFEFPVSQTQ